MGICILANASAAQPDGELASQIEAILGTDEMSNALWGVSVADAQTGEVLLEQNADLSMVPASITKLFTTAAALDILGPSFRYRTNLYTSSTIQNGVLMGDIIVRGAGDPTIGLEPEDRGPMAPFRDWLDSLRTHGIERIEGNIVGDDSAFDDTAWGSDWAWDDLVYGYAAETSGLSYHGNAVQVTLTARTVGQPALISLRPKGSGYLEILNFSNATASDTRLHDEYRRMPGTNQVEIFADLPVGSSRSVSLSVPNPALFFVRTMHDLLEAAGMPVDGGILDIDSMPTNPSYDSDSLRIVASWDSPTLSSMVREINKESNNLWAEAVLRTLSIDTPKSTNDGLEQSKHFYATAGIDTARLQLVDGSGLSRKNLVTPRMVTTLLHHMTHHPDLAVRRTFEESLAIGGVDGSLSHRFTNTVVDVRAKTGTLGNVSGLAGIIATANGRRLHFALICNNYTIPTRQVRRAQDAVVTLLAAQ